MKKDFIEFIDIVLRSLKQLVGLLIKFKEEKRKEKN